MHLDLKLENFLVDYNIHKKIELILCDFNLAQIHKSNYYNLEKNDYIVGTKHFMAPEIFNYEYCKSSDIYSIGCLLYLLYTNKYYDGNINYNLLKEKNISSNIVSIITDCLKKY